MHHQEKKYRVTSFNEIEKTLAATDARLAQASESTHYYAQTSKPGVTKLVIHGDKDAAIHILDELDGKFTLRENIPVRDKDAGLQWLKDQGFDEISLVEMKHTDYEYKGGVIGLYTINDVLKSVILDYPPGRHENIERELGLVTAEVINVPYNVYLQQHGQLQTQRLNNPLRA